MMTIKTTEGNTLTGRPETIAQLMWEMVKDHLGEHSGADSPEAFLRSLADRGLITIEGERA